MLMCCGVVGVRRVLFLICLGLPGLLPAQFFDDFSNGNFTEDPPWLGHHDKFIVQDGVLRLWDEAAGTAWLATQNQVMHDTQWDFWLRIAFTPSDNNHPRIYLVSNQSDLDGPLNGYFVQVGRTGGDMKRLFLCRQDGQEISTLISGITNLADGSNNILRIRVLRDDTGQWALYADPSGGELMVPQGSAYDATHLETQWFGIHCTYTVSNSRAFYFDDFRVGDILPEDPPRVERVDVLSASSLDLHFSRVLDAASAGATTNYIVDQGIGHPILAHKRHDKPYVVRLFFGTEFLENHVYSISASGVESPDGQMMEDFEDVFVNYLSSHFDVVFNEIMANSRPQVGLPPHDWVELYNTTHMPINLGGWSLDYGSGSREIPPVVIPPGGYLVLCSEAALAELDPYGLVVAIPGLPSTAFTIGGTQLLLHDQEGKVISFVRYTDRWYRNAEKAKGGWSLEKIDPYNYCQGEENWKASENPLGGTPGTSNSVRGNNPNLARPRITHTGLIEPNRVSLHFSEPMKPEALADASNYHLDHGLGQALEAGIMSPDWTAVELLLPDSLQEGRIYRLEAGEALVDCESLSLMDATARLARPAPADAAEVVINEILFNPPLGGARYVELYNRSHKVFDLRQFLLASRDTLQQSLESIRFISDGSRLFFPGDYLVLTNNAMAVQNSFHSAAEDSFAELESMPRMTNTQGIVVLANLGHELIDQVIYSEEMQLPMLVNPRGVALERLYPCRPSHENSNWHSASASVGYGTPGYRNSQYTPVAAQDEVHFFLDPELFVPDGSGDKDILNICYDLDAPGHVAHVRVFDVRGRHVNTLARAKLLGTSGCITWDGSRFDRTKASVGIYVIHVDLLRVDGQLRHYRMAATLGGRF